MVNRKTSTLNFYLRNQISPEAWVHNLVRLFIFGLLVFECLNILKVLNYSPQFTWRGLLSTSIITFIILEVIAYLYYKKKDNKSLHSSVWILTFIAIFLDFIADVFHFYARFDWWDQALHFTSSNLICFIIFVIISAFWLDKFQFKLMHKLTRLRFAIYISSVSALALGALYEVEEYSEDLIYGTQRSGLGTDTANDLMFNFLGILVMSLSLWVILSRAKRKSTLLK